MINYLIKTFLNIRHEINLAKLQNNLKDKGILLNYSCDETMIFDFKILKHDLLLTKDLTSIKQLEKIIKNGYILNNDVFDFTIFINNKDIEHKYNESVDKAFNRSLSDVELINNFTIILHNTENKYFGDSYNRARFVYKVIELVILHNNYYVYYGTSEKIELL